MSSEPTSSLLKICVTPALNILHQLSAEENGLELASFLEMFLVAFFFFFPALGCLI